MPIVRVDVPDWATREQMTIAQREITECIARTWAKEHIWVAVRPMYAERDNSTVILTVDLRDGRGREAERTQVLFDLSLKTFAKAFGTTEDKLIVLVRKFSNDEAVSGGAWLPPLSELTPDLDLVADKSSSG